MHIYLETNFRARADISQALASTRLVPNGELVISNLYMKDRSGNT